MNVDFNIINQKGSPAIFSDTYANRPAASYPGRLFISTDTKEIYRDTGSAWEEIAGSGSGNIQGSGTANYVPKFTDTETIGNSQIRDDGTGVGIGVAPSAVYKLDISGSQRNTLTAAGGLSIVQSGVLEASYGVYNSSSGAAFLFEKFDDATATFTDSAIFALGGFYTKISDGSSNFYNSFFSNGNVAFGSVTDASYKLDVNGTGRFSGALTGTTATFQKTLATSTTLEQMLVIITNFASGVGTGFGGAIVFRGTTAGNENQDNAQITGYNEDGANNGYALGFWTRPSVAAGMVQRLTILRNGNVGIATASPSFKLDVSSANSYGIRIWDGTNAGGSIGFQSLTAAANVGYLAKNSYYDGSIWTVNNSAFGAGYIAFQSNGDININSQASGTGEPSEKLRLFSTGNLAINSVTDASYKLDVNGTGRFSGLLTGIEGVLLGETPTNSFTISRSGVTGNLILASNQGGIYGYNFTSTGTATFSGAVAIGNTVAVSVATPSTHKVTMLIGGVTYYLLASNV